MNYLCSWNLENCKYANDCDKSFGECKNKKYYNGFPDRTLCKHTNTHYEDWPDGGAIEVCDKCGMSRHHWEWDNSDWIMIKDIEKARKETQEGIDKMLRK